MKCKICGNEAVFKDKMIPLCIECGQAYAERYLMNHNPNKWDIDKYLNLDKVGRLEFVKFKRIKE